MDCPYYEQLQFAIDTRLEALFTYVVTKDSALARKALIDFHYEMQPEGLTAAKYPSVYLQILTTFSLHYIYMLWEYYKQTGDKETLRICRGDIDRILDYYDSHIGEAGIVGRLEYMNEGIALLELDCTTCPETPKEARSDCHAWSALLMYEMIRTIAGIGADEIGWKHVMIAPHMMDLNDVHGSAATPYGNIVFDYEKIDGKWNYSLKIPEGICVTFHFEDGRIHELSEAGEYHFS